MLCSARAGRNGFDRNQPALLDAFAAEPRQLHVSHSGLVQRGSCTTARAFFQSFIQPLLYQFNSKLDLR
jgi:hypothetical protein